MEAASSPSALTSSGGSSPLAGLPRLPSGLGLAALAAFHSSQRTASSASFIHWTTWKGSMTHLALGQRRLTSCPIRLAPSAVTTSMARLCSRVRLVEEQVEHVLAGALVRPDEAAAVVVDDHRDVLVALLVRRLVDADAAHAVEPRGAARGLQLGVDAPAHAAHAVPLDAGEPETAEAVQRTASHATQSSKSRVKRAPCRAQGTASVRTPCSGRRTLQGAYSR